MRLTRIFPTSRKPPAACKVGRVTPCAPGVLRRARSDAPYLCLIAKAAALMALFGLLAGSNRGFSAETSLTESQVKSLFLLNFAKYVDWPADAFETANAPIVIGMISGTGE